MHIQNIHTTSGALAFCSAVKQVSEHGPVYARRPHHPEKVYRIVCARDKGPTFTLDRLFHEDYPPVHIGDFAAALRVEQEAGRPVPDIEVFNGF